MENKTIAVLLKTLLLQITFLFFQDLSQIHIKSILLLFHLVVTNENPLLNMLSGRQECSFFSWLPQVLILTHRATTSGSLKQSAKLCYRTVFIHWREHTFCMVPQYSSWHYNQQASQCPRKYRQKILVHFHWFIDSCDKPALTITDECNLHLSV